MARGALLLIVLALALAAPAGASTERSRGLVAALTSLDEAITSKAPSAVHAAKARLIDEFYAGAEHDVIENLDCVATQLQRARAGKARARGAAANACMQRLPANAAALKRSLKTILARIRAGRAFGAKATALRKAAVAYVRSRHERTIEGVTVSAAYADLECIDVKVESGRRSGASSCARRLKRLVEDNAPLSPLVTFGSDLTGDPVAMPGTYPEDTEFWTKGVTVPEDGTITRFRLRTGSDPIDLPLRFSVVRPQPDGQVKVITTTDPPYPLPGGSAQTHTFSTSSLSFKCCAVQKGDIVTADNSGAGQTRNPYVWFAAKAGFTTFSHTCAPCGISQNPGTLWTGTPHDNYELLLQVEMRPD